MCLFIGAIIDYKTQNDTSSKVDRDMSNLIDYYSYVYIPSSIHDYKILEILSKYMTREEYMKNQNIFSMVRNINNYDINYFEVYKNFRYGFSSYDSPSVYIAINLMDRLAKITLEVGESHD